jgi:transposase-like protein
MAQTRGGISARQIQHETSVTLKTAWRMCKQVRSMLYEDFDKFDGEVKMDEIYFGDNAQDGVRGRGSSNKIAVFGIVERGGKVEARVVPNVKHSTIMPMVVSNVEQGTQVFTIEGFWSQVKGVVRGVYGSVSATHLPKYRDEYAFRYNHRDDVTPMFLTVLSKVKLSVGQVW